MGDVCELVKKARWVLQLSYKCPTNLKKS